MKGYSCHLVESVNPDGENKWTIRYLYFICYHFRQTLINEQGYFCENNMRSHDFFSLGHSGLWSKIWDVKIKTLKLNLYLSLKCSSAIILYLSYIQYVINKPLDSSIQNESSKPPHTILLIFCNSVSFSRIHIRHPNRSNVNKLCHTTTFFRTLLAKFLVNTDTLCLL